MKAGVPMIPSTVSRFRPPDSTMVAMPKSRTLTTSPSGCRLNKMLAGLMSRWMMPASCAVIRGVAQRSYDLRGPRERQSAAAYDLLL